MDFAALDTPLELSDAQLAHYHDHRYLKVKSVIPPALLAHFNKTIGNIVDMLSADTTPLAERDTYGQAFLQKMNLWVAHEVIRPLIFSKRIAKIAADLMEVEGVRMYHDQALFKEAGGGITPWHADQYYWPLATDKTITAWIPLQAVPLVMGPLEFSAGSHAIQEGRDLSIGDESERVMSERLRVTDFDHVVEPFDAGEISFHSGWVFHRAGANKTDEMRKVMTIIYMDKDMRLKQPENANQINDWQTWCPGAEVGEIIDTPLNPVLYP